MEYAACNCKQTDRQSACSSVRRNKKQNSSHEFIKCKQNFAKLVTKFESVINKLSSALLLTQLHKSCFALSRLIFRQKPIRARKAHCLTLRYFSPLSSSLYSSSPRYHHFAPSLHSFSCFSFGEFCSHLYYLHFLTLSLTSLLIPLDRSFLWKKRELKEFIK
jgi:hypothetical protein